MNAEEHRNCVDPLDLACVLVGLLFLYYATASFIGRFNPNSNLASFGVGILFALGCITVFLLHGRKIPMDKQPSPSRWQSGLIGIAAILLFYLVSYLQYLRVGETLGQVLDGIAGVYLFFGLKWSFPKKLRTLLAPVLVGLCLFFVIRDCAFDTLTMASDSLAPKVIKGQKLIVNKVAFGLRLPFTPMYVAKWGSPSVGDLVVFYRDNVQRVYCKEIVGTEGGLLKLTGMETVDDNHLLGRTLIL